MTHTKKSFVLSGMTCTACEKIVSKRLQIIPGVEDVIAITQTGTVTLTISREIATEEIVLALQDTHYTVITNS